METKVSIIILSHINDFKIDFKMEHLDFAAYLVLKFPDTSCEIDPDKVYQEFLNSRN